MHNNDDSDLYRRIIEYGSRGIIQFESGESAGVHPDAWQSLQPPDW